MDLPLPDRDRAAHRRPRAVLPAWVVMAVVGVLTATAALSAAVGAGARGDFAGGSAKKVCAL